MKYSDVFDLSKYTKIGYGAHGTVYRLDENRCLKVFKLSRALQSEVESLQQAAGCSFVPKLYSWGEDYLIRQYIPGVPLFRYLQAQPLDLAISAQLIQIIRTLQTLGFLNLDLWLKNIIIQPNGTLWLIDLVEQRQKKLSIPVNTLRNFQSLGMLNLFLQHVETLAPDFYLSWNTQRDSSP